MRCGTSSGARHTQQAGPDGESSELSADGRQWVWISFTPEFRLILAAFVGPRTFESALQLIQMTAAVVLGVPCFFSDGFSCAISALIEVYHTLKTFPRTGKPGRPKAPGEGAPHLAMGRWSEAPRPSPGTCLSCTLRFQTLQRSWGCRSAPVYQASQPHPT